MFTKVIGSQIPTTSKSFSERCALLMVPSSRFYSKSEKREITKERKLQEVSTTGWSFSDAEGNRVSKYGVYWGPNDERNAIRRIPHGTNVTAILSSLLDVLNTAREEDPPPSLRVYTDLKNDNFLRELSEWAKRDFYKRDGTERMSNWDLLKDIFIAVQGLDLKLEHRSSTTPNTPNYVVKSIIGDGYKNNKTSSDEHGLKLHNEKSEFCNIEDKRELDTAYKFVEGHQCDKYGRITSRTKTTSWPEVFVGVRCRQVKSKKGASEDDFISAGYCTHWPKGESNGGESFRFVPFPVTHFRATLAAIEEALKQAVELKMDKVVVITSSSHFMQLWKDRWTGKDMKPIQKGKEFYDRIHDLCDRIYEVHFRYQKERDELDVYKEIDKKCKEGFSLALVGKDVSEYELEIEDMVVTRECIDASVPIIRMFKTGTEMNAGYVWETKNDSNEQEEAVSCCGTPETIIRIMEEALKKCETTILVRCDSEKMIKSFEAHLEVWKRNGWRNSLHKKIRRVELWERAWELKKKVKVFWELMDEYDDEDVEKNRLIPEYKKAKK